MQISRLANALTIFVSLTLATSAALGDETQVKALRDVFVGKPVALRMPWAGEKLRFDVLGQPEAKMKTEAWLANTVILVSALDLDKHRLRLRGVRALLVYDPALKTMAAMPGYERVEITFERKPQNSTVEDILFTTSKVLHGSNLQGYLAQHWQPQADYVAEMESRTLGKPSMPGGMRQTARIAGRLDATRPVYFVDRGVVLPPMAVYTPDPSYDPIARENRIQDTTKLYLVINEQGEPEVMQLAHPLHSGLDARALRAVAHWKFKPATMAGSAVACVVSVEINFRLY